MILVDVYVPVIDTCIDFKLDEDAKIGKLMSEMISMLSVRMKAENDLTDEDFYLYLVEDQRLLNKHGTLKSCGVKDGAKLMLI